MKGSGADGRLPFIPSLRLESFSNNRHTSYTHVHTSAGTRRPSIRNYRSHFSVLHAGHKGLAGRHNNRRTAPNPPSALEQGPDLHYKFTSRVTFQVVSTPANDPYHVAPICQRISSKFFPGLLLEAEILIARGPNLSFTSGSHT